METGNQSQNIPAQQSVMKEFPKKEGKKQTIVILLASILVVMAGIASGWLLSSSKAKGNSVTQTSDKQESQIEQEIQEGDIEGLDEAEGTLIEGGIEGEGTHHLEKEGGPSQNVYLTSTIIDLQPLVGKKVHIWGETISGIKASWLMDVIKVKELE
ncbi:MAG: hypothetical protein US60_C0005G0021 [Microgenomates group bacterium GW2011_GWC1_37_8]|uniref:Uncharacterized protein n=2 Tax=Candidatus Woeseibacteriota TaxID=1752722 RepID=A0A0G0LEC4_9BACT|nr:MAG: hypothetical protein US60_C0005G0021 [Microgenomates group bacterium GW2011_GWC1_37_8]KKQ86280.1 MAG: hypothetical protein UT08_C0001G0146 [Candidatus Woesebacteria bacterium GW2011_GWB1_38_8]OGM21563.1 MAG: hypothetical protein A2863_04280 [Candidatus Woesebacteria bacterium RIFCSPHIGHO2_01_FULL_38_9b]